MVLFNLCKHSKLRKTAVPVAGYVTHKEFFFFYAEYREIWCNCTQEYLKTI